MILKYQHLGKKNLRYLPFNVSFLLSKYKLNIGNFLGYLYYFSRSNADHNSKLTTSDIGPLFTMAQIRTRDMGMKVKTVYIQLRNTVYL